MGIGPDWREHPVRLRASGSSCTQRCIFVNVDTFQALHGCACAETVTDHPCEVPKVDRGRFQPGDRAQAYNIRTWLVTWPRTIISGLGSGKQGRQRHPGLHRKTLSQ